MAGTGDIKAGRAYVEIFADKSPLMRGLKSISAELQAWGASVSNIGRRVFAAGAAVAAGLFAATKVFSNMGDEIAKASDRTGIAVENLSQLGYAADQSGSSLAGLETGIKQMHRTLGDAADGGKEAQESLAKLGLTAADLQKLTPDEQFKLLAERLSSIEDPALRNATAMKIFGKSAMDLMPLMKNGAAGIEALQKEADDFGLTISETDARNAEAFGDSMSLLWRTVKQVVFQLGAALGPTLKEVGIAVARNVAVVSKWIGAHRDMILTAFKVALGVAAAGAAIFALGKAITAAGLAVSGLRAGFALIFTVVSTLGPMFALLISPIGLATIAIAGLAAVFFDLKSVASGIGEGFAEVFQTLKADALDAFAGISDALATGNIGLAAKILWLTLKMEWARGVNALMEYWVRFKVMFLSLGNEIVTNIATFWVDATASIAKTWALATQLMMDAWDGFSNYIKNGWEGTQNWLADRWLDLMGLMDKDLDVEAAKKLNDQQTAANRKTIDEGTGESVKKRQEATDKSLADIDAKQKERQAKVAADHKAAEDGMMAQGSSAISKADEELKAAKAEFAAAVADAKKKREDAVGIKAPEITNKKGVIPDLEEMVAKSSVSSTFNADAILSLQGTSGPQERAAKAAEKLLEKTDRMTEFLRRIDAAGPVRFA